MRHPHDVKEDNVEEVLYPTYLKNDQQVNTASIQPDKRRRGCKEKLSRWSEEQVEVPKVTEREQQPSESNELIVSGAELCSRQTRKGLIGLSKD